MTNEVVTRASGNKDNTVHGFTEGLLNFIRGILRILGTDGKNETGPFLRFKAR